MDKATFLKRLAERDRKEIYELFNQRSKELQALFEHEFSLKENSKTESVNIVKAT